MGGWGSETAGILSGYIQGKSYGLFGPSTDVVVNGAVTVNSASQGILAVRDQMTSGTCLPKYMAVTLLPRDNTVFTQAATASDPWTLTLELGAYSWGTYDWTSPQSPSLAPQVDAGAMKLAVGVVLATISALY